MSKNQNEPPQKSMGVIEAATEGLKEGLKAYAPGLTLDNVLGDLKAELKQQLAHGSHELAAALFNGSGFVMYPRGSRDDPDRGVHGPEQPQQSIEQRAREGRSL